MDINVKIIPHKEQRYETLGDWWFVWSSIVDSRSHVISLEIRVSDLGKVNYNYLTAMHEQIEAMLCLTRGIKEEDVSTFDKMYEVKYQAKESGYEVDDPGSHYLAPYRKEHFFATSLERLMAAELNVNWEDYDAAVMAL